MEREHIAIVGIGCRFPGGGGGPEDFWQALVEGRDAIREIPPDRWSIAAHFDPRPGQVGKSITRWGGFVDGIDLFDPAPFGISPREASLLDPQQRLLLETAWEALEDAGEPVDRLRGSPTGVFVGISTHDYELLQTSPDERSDIDIYSTTGGTLSIAANRLSYCFDLRGPSLAVDTACSSSLIALHLACESLRRGDCTRALVGGVNALLAPMPFVAFSRMSMLSPTGRCHAFDAAADGFVRGEGAGVVVLKPLARAEADGDRIYAVVRGTAANQDGRTNGLTVPSAAAQGALVAAACERAGVEPAAIEYVEAHGTGTPVGDPIEASALGGALSPGRLAGRPLRIGSVKTNVGHLEAGAGIAGIVKLALSMHHGVLPGNLHFREPNPNIDFEGLGIRVLTRAEEAPGGGRRPWLAGINSFGFGGSNAHAVLEARARPAVRPRRAARRARLLAISAGTPEGLREAATRHAERLAAAPDLDALCRSAGERRTHHAERLAAVGRTREELAGALRAFAAGDTSRDAVAGRPGEGSERGVVFVFSGQGPQWWAMGRELLREEPVFRETIGEIDAILAGVAPAGSWRLLEELSRDAKTSRLAETRIAQPAIFALQVALARLLRSWGVEPAAVVGHSVGEVAAAHVSGALPLEQAARVIFERGRSMDLACGQGRMLAAALRPDEAALLVGPVADRVAVGAINGPRSVTLSGDARALEVIAGELAGREVFHRFVPVRYAFHSPQMDPVRPGLLEALGRFGCSRSRIPMWSTVTAAETDGLGLDAGYWWRNVRETVRFAPAINGLVDRGFRVFLEIGAHPVLANAVGECLRERSVTGVVVPTLRRKEPERARLLLALAALHVAGVSPDWGALHPEAGGRAELPTYPWQRKSYWHESPGSRERRLDPVRHPFLGRDTKRAAPTWEAWLDREALPALEDHRVQGQVMFPAAGFLEMALEASDRHLGEGPWIVEDVDFLRALVLPACPDAARVETTVDPASSRFTISSAGGDAWTVHATGAVRPAADAPRPEAPRLRDLRSRVSERVDVAGCYEAFRQVGLDFGPAFRGIERLWRGDREALGRIQPTREVRADRGRYQIPPPLLDACFQVLSAAVPPPAEGEAPPLYLPVHVDRVLFHATPPGRWLWSHARLTSREGNTIVGEIRILDERGRLVAAIDGFTCQAIRPAARSGPESWLYDSRWEERPFDGAARPVREAEFLAPPRTVAAEARRVLAARQRGESGRARFLRLEPALDRLVAAYAQNALLDLGWTPRRGATVETSALARRLRVAGAARPAFGRLLGILASEGMLAPAGKGWRVRAALRRADTGEAWRSLLGRFPALHAELTLLRRTGGTLAAILRGEVDPLGVIAPEGSLAVLEHFYQDAPSAVDYNAAVAGAVAAAVARVPEGRRVRILEIGAGTGGTTAHVLPRLPAGRVEYVFSDVSAAFFARAEQKLFDYPFVEMRALDIERDPVGQGFEPHSFDVMLACDALHATRDLRTTLANVRRLLASRGLLVLLEIDRPTRWIDLVFGLTPGWWRFGGKDGREGSPLLDEAGWKAALAGAGFETAAVTRDVRASGRSGQALVAARGPEIEAAPEPAADAEGSWLVLADGGGTGAALASELRARGARAVTVLPGDRTRRIGEDAWELRTGSLGEVRQLLEEVGPGLSGVVHLWSLDAPAPARTTPASLRESEVRGCHAALHLVQTLVAAEPPPRLVLVTRGAHAVLSPGQAVSPAQAPLWGLGRVVQNEQRRFRCRLIDLDPAISPDEARDLARELHADDGEDEVAWRGGIRLANRLVPAALEPVTRPAADGYRLEVPSPGALDQLRLTARGRRRPGPGEVEIEVRAAALNFRDVMKALGIYPIVSDRDLLVGDECSGVVSAVGPGVRGVRAGDRVLAMDAGCFASHLTVDAGSVAPMPPGLGFEDAVTIPVAFLTSWYALRHLGKVRPGEAVLVHAATGGVGLSAIQIARLAGARVFATAGSPEKRDFLRALGVEEPLDSRSLAFAGRVREMTGGRGVDLVLSSLAGAAIGKSLEALAPHGRFLEIGKRDIYQGTRVGLRPFRHGLSFFAIDMQQVMKDHPGQTRRLVGEFLEELRHRRLTPLPHRVFPVSEIGAAFRLMAKAQHVGKIVVTMEDDRVRPRVPAESADLRLRRQATYLVTGGLGGFGLALAEWMAERGARHLVLAGRRGAATPEARRVVSRLRRRGVEVVVARADVSDPAAVERLFRRIGRGLPPLRGVVHAAMVLDDGLLAELDTTRFRKVMDPKVAGAWNLHVATRRRALDFFVLFSSVSAIVGAPAQGNYVAANAFLDALAHHRRAEGLPALAVDWGGLADVGYVARHERVEEHLTRQGILGIPVADALSLLGRLLGSGRTQIGVVRVDWQRWADFLPAVRTAPRFASLFEGGSGEVPASPASARDAILGVPEAERLPKAVAFLREQVARVLRTPASALDATRPLSELGVDSLMAFELVNQLESQFRLTFPPSRLGEGATIERIAASLLELLSAAPGEDAPAGPTAGAADPAAAAAAERIVALRSGGDRTPLVCIHPAGGLANVYRDLAAALPADVPVYALQAPSVAGDGPEPASMAALGEEYAACIVERFGSGPLHLAGFSLGGLFALATAAALEARGVGLSLVALFDPDLRLTDPATRDQTYVRHYVVDMYRTFARELGIVRPLAGDRLEAEARELSGRLAGNGGSRTIVDWLTERGHLVAGISRELVGKYFRLFEAHVALVEGYEPVPLAAPVHLWTSSREEPPDPASVSRWRDIAAGGLVETRLEATHFELLFPPTVFTIAQTLGDAVHLSHSSSAKTDETPARAG